MKNFKYIIVVGLILILILPNFSQENTAQADTKIYDTWQAEILDIVDNNKAVITFDNGNYYIIELDKDELFFIGDIIDVEIDTNGDPINLIEFEYDWSLLFE